jgi:hypothetical protein
MNLQVNANLLLLSSRTIFLMRRYGALYQHNK